MHPTILAQKAHGAPGLTMDEIHWIVEDQCREMGVEPNWDLPPQQVQDNQSLTTKSKKEEKPKWRICQNFSKINKVTKVTLMLQGDIRAKQQRLVGHEYVCVIDFAAGFYAIEVDEKSQPYLCIYTEGRGFQCYQRMPMRTLGSPACFADLTAQAFKDLVVELGLETFVDDNRIADNEFEDLLQHLRKFLIQCHQKGLSLSPSKLQLFMQEVVFGGPRIGKEGIKPDIAKLEVVARWPQPANLLDLMCFLGLTGYFRSLIKDYARIVTPLTDLQRNLDMPQPSVKTGKRKYWQYLRDHKLDTYWTMKHNRAFTKLKQVLTSDPVRAPKFNGTPFILTTDGCKDRFGVVLLQEFTTTLDSGETVTKIHSIGFTSKCMSPAEGRYKPYVLEFAALKFGFNHFSDTIWGFLIQVEMDCIALWDTLCNVKLSLVHARWKDGISAYQITDI